MLIPQILSTVEHILPQFGFRIGHSCSQQLHKIANVTLNTYETKQVCLGLFLDTEQAFDKVLHNGLLYKIKNQLTDAQYRIVESYLVHRTFAVRLDEFNSKLKLILSGVPQGSVLGPLLCIIYTHDFCRHNTITVAQFALFSRVLQLDFRM